MDMQNYSTSPLASYHPEGGGGGGQGVRTCLKNHKYIGFLSNTGPYPPKNHKAAKPAFNDADSKYFFVFPGRQEKHVPI